ncbi:unnamed protein product [Mucor hiemalis]
MSISRNSRERIKKLVSNIAKFETNAKNKPLLQFAARIRDTRFEVLSSNAAEDYWFSVASSVASASIERKRLEGHLYDEQSIADVILDYAKKRHRSNRRSTEVNLAIQEPTTSRNEVCESSQGSASSINETNIWEIWSIVLSYVDTCDDPNIDINEYSLEHLGIIQLGDGIGNNTTRKLFPKDLITTSNDILRKEQVDIFSHFRTLYNSFFKALNQSVESCEELLMRYILKVKKSENRGLIFCYKVFSTYIEVFKRHDINRSEILYNYRLVWKLMDAVVEACGDSFQFSPGEVRLNAIKSELVRRGLSTANYYNADGVIIDITHNMEVALLETSGAYGVCSSNKETTDHVKAAYGLLAMLHTVALSYNYADIQLFNELHIPFIHVTKKKIRLWTLNLTINKTYVLHRRRSCTVPITNTSCNDDIMATGNLMWELKEIIGNVSRILGALKKSHESNTTIVNAVKLESFLAETVDVKLPCKHLYDDEDIFLSSSPLRPDCVGDDEYIV